MFNFIEDAICDKKTIADANHLITDICFPESHHLSCFTRCLLSGIRHEGTVHYH